MLITLVAVTLVDLRLYQLRYALPIYGLISIIVLSGLINGLYFDMIEFAMRYIYMVALALLLFRAIRLYGVDPILRGILCALSPIVVLQYAAIPLGIVKIGKEDASLSYIATYFHEGPYSQLALGFLIVVSLIRWRNPGHGVLLAGVGLASLLLANYRTTILGALPVLAVGVAVAGRRLATASALSILAPLGLVLGVGLAVFHEAILPTRFSDIGQIGNVTALAFEAPVVFTREDREFFNYRVFLWSNYIHSYLDADIYKKLVGFGPASWQYTGFFKIMYAHNTFLSWLYQFGVIGLAAMFGTLAYNLRLAASSYDRGFSLRLVACLIGYYLISLAAEPLYAMEGVLMHAILFGVAWGMRQPAAPVSIIVGPPVRTPA
jgi:O-Antigen ligase